MRWVSRLVTFGLLALVLGGLALALHGRIGRRKVGQGFRSYVMMRDASAMPVGSRVMIAGVQVGEIEKLAIQGDLARVDLRLRNDVPVYDDAVAEKRLSSLFGDAYLELRPGGGEPGEHRRLHSGEPIPHVIEAASTDRVLRAIDRTLPRIEQGLHGAAGGLRGLRQWMGGPARDKLEVADRWLVSGAVSGPLSRTSDAMTRLESWTVRVSDATAGAAPSVNRRLDDLATRIASATQTMRSAQADLSTGLGDFRQNLHVVDDWTDDANTALDRWGAQREGRDPGAAVAAGHERNGFGKLVNDKELGFQIDQVTEDAATAVSGLARLKTWVGLSTEYNVFSRAPRFYLTAEIYGRSDNFYMVELEKDQLGDVPEVQLSDGITDGTFTRTAIIHERLRFTAQWGKRVGWLQVRFGLKESTVGIGADAVLLGGRLRFETDAFDLSGNRVPRLKLAAALRVFESVYIHGGVDDVLQSPGYLPIQPWAPGHDVPSQFERLRYGRDYFAGLSLRFDERDINSLLLLYGAVLGAVL